MKYTKLTLIADEGREVIQDTLGHKGPWTGYREERIELEVHGLRHEGEHEIEEMNYYSLDDDDVLVPFEVEPGDVLYLVIPRYSDGGTFSHTEGYFKLAGAFKNESEAEERKAAIVNGEWPPKTSWSYRPWEGYFSGLGDVEIHEVTVRKGE